MSFIYISGQSGAGKSTIRNELLELGYEAHDTDEDDFTAWYNIETGEKVDWATAQRNAEWLKRHSHRLSADKVNELSEKSKRTSKAIFLCGIPSNGLDFKDLYDKIMFVAIDSQTMQQRVQNRTTNNYGKRPEELEQMLYWHDKMLETYKGVGAVVIDGTLPKEIVLQHILEQLSNN